MKELVNTFFLGAVIAGALALQLTRVFAIGGIQPNFVLLALLFIAIHFELLEKRVPILLAIFAIFLGIVFLFAQFWIFEALVLSGVVLLALTLKNFWTGDRLADFALALIFTNISFYFLIYVFKIGVFRIDLVFYEMLYNFVVGAPFWYFLRDKKI